MDEPHLDGKGELYGKKLIGEDKVEGISEKRKVDINRNEVYVVVRGILEMETYIVLDGELCNRLEIDLEVDFSDGKNSVRVLRKGNQGMLNPC